MAGGVQDQDLDTDDASLVAGHDPDVVPRTTAPFLQINGAHARWGQEIANGCMVRAHSSPAEGPVLGRKNRVHFDFVSVSGGELKEFTASHLFVGWRRSAYAFALDDQIALGIAIEHEITDGAVKALEQVTVRDELGHKKR